MHHRFADKASVIDGETKRNGRSNSAICRWVKWFGGQRSATRISGFDKVVDKEMTKEAQFSRDLENEKPALSCKTDNHRLTAGVGSVGGGS